MNSKVSGTFFLGNVQESPFGQVFGVEAVSLHQNKPRFRGLGLRVYLDPGPQKVCRIVACFKYCAIILPSFESFR